MFFTSAIVAQSHYQGKTHAKSVKLVLGSSPTISTTPPTDSSPSSSDTHPLPMPPPPAPPITWLVTNSNTVCRSCFLCGAWFNNPAMAQQHYEGKKHRRNAARRQLLEQLADNLDSNQNTG
nr:zinc finger matrin-type protein 4-like [Oncorhynchus nerka]